MTVLPPLQAPRRADEAVVRVPPLAMTPGNTALLLAGASLVLDQATKSLADRVLVPNRFVQVVPDWVPLVGDDWGWQLTYNPGGALGFAPEALAGRLLGAAVGAFVGEWFFVLVTALVTVIVARNLPQTRHLRSGVAYGLLLSGAWGNGLDRLLRPPGFPSGQVVDFVAIGGLPRFNVADIAIVAGFVLLLVAMFRDEDAPA